MPATSSSRGIEYARRMSTSLPSFILSRRFSLIRFSRPVPAPALTLTMLCAASFTAWTTSCAVSPRTTPWQWLALISTLAGGMCSSFSSCARTSARNPFPIRPISPIATASTVMSTTVVPPLFKTSAFANNGSFTGPAARSVMSTLATPAESSAARAALIPAKTASNNSRPFMAFSG